MKMKEKPNRLPDEYIVECKTKKETNDVISYYYNDTYDYMFWTYVICRKDLKMGNTDCLNNSYEDYIRDKYKNMPLFSYKEWKKLISESVLPKRWCIFPTKEQFLIVREWAARKSTHNYSPFVHHDMVSFDYEGNYRGYENTRITFEQFQKYVLKQKSITNIINNMKQEFTIEGSLPLQEAFVKECNIPYSKTAGSIEKGFNDFPYLCPSSYSKEFTSNTDKQSVHFSLPTQWEEAKDYVLDFFKEEDKIVIDGYEAEVEKGKIVFGCNKFALADLQAIKRVISIANTLEYTLLIDGKKAQVEDDDDKVMDIPTIDTLINMLKK